jgi:hypothetical protein
VDCNSRDDEHEKGDPRIPRYARWTFPGSSEPEVIKSESEVIKSVKAAEAIKKLLY